jgi:hypothetical protein
VGSARRGEYNYEAREGHYALYEPRRDAGNANKRASFAQKAPSDSGSEVWRVERRPNRVLGIPRSGRAKALR